MGVYAQRFDTLFSSLAQRRGFRDYLQGLLLPRDRNKTLTGLAGAEPITGAQHRQVQRLQWFLSESAWDHEQVNERRVELLCGNPATAPHAQGALVIDDTGDRKDGTATAHVARQHRRPSSCNCCLTPLPPARRYTSTFHPNQQTTDKEAMGTEA
jgi:SRSO17 transposase